MQKNNFSDLYQTPSYKPNFDKYTAPIFLNNCDIDTLNNNPNFKNVKFYKDNQTYSSHCTNFQATSTALNGMQIQNSELSNKYFSVENRNKIQEMIKNAVYKKTNKKYRLTNNQDETDLFIQMRASFLAHAKHLPTHIDKQLKQLNRDTLNDLLPDLLSNVQQEFAYQEEINKPLQVINHPLNVNATGRRTLPSTTSIFWR